ncbi:MAG: putative rRNA maturation factor [Fimbriimonadaceae bacterium]|nr:putative rRNA maturation factor [Fimbriimonadaceae bacterium]
MPAAHLMEPPSKTQINVLNSSGNRVRLEPIRRAVGVALRRHGRETAAVNVLLTGDEEIRSLNRQFRNVDEATDVLSFPAGEFPNAPLGDIAISIEYARKQAQARGVSLGQELGYLAIHGALHLVGFDDETEADRARMVEEMNLVAMDAGLKPDHEWHSLLHAATEHHR